MEILLLGKNSTCFNGMSQLDGVRRDKSLPQHMEALRAEPPLAAFTD